MGFWLLAQTGSATLIVPTSPFLKLKFCFSFCVPLYVWVWICTCEWSDFRAQKVSDSVELELPVLMGSWMWVLRTEHRSSGRETHTLNLWAISQVLWVFSSSCLVGKDRDCYISSSELYSLVHSPCQGNMCSICIQSKCLRVSTAQALSP